MNGEFEDDREEAKMANGGAGLVSRGRGCVWVGAVRF